MQKESTVFIPAELQRHPGAALEEGWDRSWSMLPSAMGMAVFAAKTFS